MYAGTPHGTYEVAREESARAQRGVGKHEGRTWWACRNATSGRACRTRRWHPGPPRYHGPCGSWGACCRGRAQGCRARRAVGALRAMSCCSAFAPRAYSTMLSSVAKSAQTLQGAIARPAAIVAARSFQKAGRVFTLPSESWPTEGSAARAARFFQSNTCAAS